MQIILVFTERKANYKYKKFILIEICREKNEL